jgi:lipid-A-disaccharide synthase
MAAGRVHRHRRPDFNLGLERKLKQAGVPHRALRQPSVWAWREGRAAKIGAAPTACCACSRWSHRSTRARRGRALRRPSARRRLRAASRTPRGARRLWASTARPVLALLPGSRAREIERLLPTFLDAADRLRAKLPALQVLVPAADARCRALIEAQLGAHPPRACACSTATRTRR